MKITEIYNIREYRELNNSLSFKFVIVSKCSCRGDNLFENLNTINNFAENSTYSIINFLITPGRVFVIYKKKPISKARWVTIGGRIPRPVYLTTIPSSRITSTNYIV